MRCLKFFVLMTSFCLLLVFVMGISAQQGTDRTKSIAVPDEMKATGYRALRIIDRAMHAVGGADRLDSFRSVALDYEGEVAATFQGFNPDDPHRMLPRTGDLLFDIANSRLLTSSVTRWPNFSMNAKSLYRDEKTFTLDEQAKTYRSGNEREVFDSWSLRIMPWIMKRLTNDPSQAIDGGVRRIEGKQYDVVLATLGTTRIYRLYFYQPTGLPEIIENLDYSSDFGDLRVRHIYSDFVRVGGMLMPMTIRMHNNEHHISTHRLRAVQINPVEKLSFLDLPAGYREATRSGEASVMRTRALSKNVYLIENLAGRDYNVMFADLGDSLIVFEAPIDLWASKIVLSEIRKVYPDKPLKYVMVTHFHDDHAAGLRTYISQGVTIITTAGNQKYFEQVGMLRHDFHKENSQLPTRSPEFEIVRNGSHELKGRNFTVKFFDLGPTSHVQENIVAYIPELGILFQGDFFRVPSDRSRPEPIRNEGRTFLEKLKKLNLPVKQLLGVHGPIGDMKDLERALGYPNSSDNTGPQ